MAKWIYNKSQSSKEYQGRPIEPGNFFEIQNNLLQEYQQDINLLNDLLNGVVTMSANGATEYIGNGSGQIDFLKDNEVSPKDPSGRQIVRTSATIEGWHYQLLSTEITTSKLNGATSIDEYGSSINITTQNIYDSLGDLITTQEGEAQAVKTVVTVSPAWSYEILGAIFSQSAIPTTNIRLFATGSPGIANVKFANGGINLKHIGLGAQKIADGRASKYMQYYSQIPAANAFKITLLHDAGTQHSFQLSFETFKAL